MKRYSVYLAGGMKSNWAEEVIGNFSYEFSFYNPKTHGLSNPEHYTQWDIHHLHNSEIVFVYLEKDNPSGVGLALEVGYARAMNKTIILVDEKTPNEIEVDKYGIVRNSANVVFDTLEEGIGYLRSFGVR